jgi:hypothetical protein
MQIRKKPAAVLVSIAAVIALTTAGAAGASTHWFGLGYPHYSQQILSGCNADWYQARADAALARPHLQNWETAVAERWLAKERAALAAMKAQGCPEGPYPLRNHG